MTDAAVPSKIFRLLTSHMLGIISHCAGVAELVRPMLLLHGVEKLFVDNFAVGNFVDGDLFHLKALVLRLEGHV